MCTLKIILVFCMQCTFFLYLFFTKKWLCWFQFSLVICSSLKIDVYLTGNDPTHEKVMKLFSAGKIARLVGTGIVSASHSKIATVGECATLCNGMHVTKCLSFNYDFGSSGHCELLEVIEGQDYKTSVVSETVTIYIVNCGFEFNTCNRKILNLLHHHIKELIEDLSAIITTF